MMISGAMAGLGGGLYYLAGTASYNIQKVLLPMGFNGISVALLAMSNPIGCIFSALFISYIQVGGESLQPVFAKEMIDIIIAVIIYLSAFALLTKTILSKFIRTDKSNVNDESKAAPATAAEPPKAVPEEAAPTDVPAKSEEKEDEKK
jgi:simple sugar transport system permease protein